MAQKAFPISPQPSDIGHIGYYYDIEGNDDEEQEKEDQV